MNKIKNRITKNEDLKIRLWYFAKEKGLGRAGGYKLEELVDKWEEDWE